MKRASEPEPLLRNWRELARRVDQFFARVAAAHGTQMQCARGCHQCCHPDLTVLPLEGIAVALGLAALPERELEALRGAAQQPHRNRCVLLRPDGSCAIYTMRPLLCRSHGLPVLQDDGISCCELNFRAGPPEGSVLNGGLLSAQLLLADQVACPGPQRRVALLDLLLRGMEAVDQTPR